MEESNTRRTRTTNRRRSSVSKSRNANRGKESYR